MLRQLNREMEEAAKRREYETAARLRDEIKALESLSLSGDPQADVQPEVFYIDPTEGLAKLGEILELDRPPRTIEGIDIANLQGEESCGSLVCFIDGKPFKGGYRRFRIKTVEGIDDYAMIREVVLRRYRHAAEGEELYPDVILIDGGPGPAPRRPERLRRDGHPPADGHLAGQAGGGDLHPGPQQADPPGSQQPGPAALAASPRRGPPLRPALPPHPAAQEDVRRGRRRRAQAAQGRPAGQTPSEKTGRPRLDNPDIHRRTPIPHGLQGPVRRSRRRLLGRKLSTSRGSA